VLGCAVLLGQERQPLLAQWSSGIRLLSWRRRCRRKRLGELANLLALMGKRLFLPLAAPADRPDVAGHHDDADRQPHISGKTEAQGGLRALDDAHQHEYSG